MTAPTQTLNDEGVDVLALAAAIERWLAAHPDHLLRHLSEHSGVHPRGIWQIRRFKRPACSFDWADRLTMAMDADLNLVAPLPDPAPKATLAPPRPPATTNAGHRPRARQRRRRTHARRPPRHRTPRAA